MFLYTGNSDILHVKGYIKGAGGRVPSNLHYELRKSYCNYGIFIYSYCDVGDNKGGVQRWL